MPRPRRRARLPRTTESSKPRDRRQPIAEHLQELRRRLIYVVGSVLVISTCAYFVQQHLVALLLKPAHGQHFIYTAPGGGIGFLFGVCTDVGLILSLPLVAYETLAFLRPLLAADTRALIVRVVAASAALALLGVAFGYLLGLPLALHFLTHQFTTSQITPLLTISEYMSFVMVYLGGSALLFQIPLVLVITDRLRPIPPRRLLSAERYVVVAALIVAMLMAPTVNVVYQLVIAVPILLAYQVGISLVWWRHRSGRRPRHIAELIERDRQIQEARLTQIAG
jgi:sec-independent protein translocase protein TatC